MLHYIPVLKTAPSIKAYLFLLLWCYSCAQCLYFLILSLPLNIIFCHWNAPCNLIIQAPLQYVVNNSNYDIFFQSTAKCGTLFGFKNLYIFDIRWQQANSFRFPFSFVKDIDIYFIPSLGGMGRVRYPKWKSDLLFVIFRLQAVFGCQLHLKSSKVYKQSKELFNTLILFRFLQRLMIMLLLLS